MKEKDNQPELENKLIKSENENTIFKYPKAPPKKESLRSNDEKIKLKTNFLELTFLDPLKKIYLYSIEILPEIAKDNFTLQYKIYKNLEESLSKDFPKKSFSGYNLFVRTSNPIEQFVKNVNVENTDYIVNFKKVGSIDFNGIFDNQIINQKKKGFIEKLIKNILLSSKGTIRFGSDRMIMKMNEENIISNNDKGKIYKGFYTSAQITENGLYLMVLNMNKYVSGKTMYEKIKQIKEENEGIRESEIREIIEEYIEDHKTVLTSYGSMRAYRIERIDFDRTPSNTSFNIKVEEGTKTINLINYYETQYRTSIKDKDQPLLVAENKIKNKKLLSNGSSIEKNENIIYLVPELVYITGMENDRNSRGRRQDIISKTKSNPQQRFNEINKIHELMNSSEQKKYKKRNGQLVTNKSSKELAEEWGINLGDNLSFQGRILSQPKLKFYNTEVIPRNGIFRTGETYDGVTFTKDNLMYIYDKRDRANFRAILSSLFSKAKQKKISIKVEPSDVESHSLDRTNTWEEIKHSLNKIHFSSKLRMVIIFLTNYLQRFYPKLKEYLTNEIKVNSQFMESRRLMGDPRKCGSIMFNIVEQINIKMGGANFYIDFSDKKAIDDKVYLICGLESKKVGKDKIDYVLTYAYNEKLNRTHTIPRTCKDNKEEKEKALKEILDEVIKGLKEHAKHPPNFVIIYRQGGNHTQNLKIREDELPIFVNYFKNKKATSSGFKNNDTKLIYICCNLKSYLKFFEERKDNNINNNNYERNDNNILNPPSGLCVDSHIIQKDKYEFYIQPQFVNQGTATPCHFEILYQDNEENSENYLPMEKLQNLSFQLCFYYWTWSGAVRVPGVLRLSTTAIDYYSRCLNHQLYLEGQKFKTPWFI